MFDLARWNQIFCKQIHKTSKLNSDSYYCFEGAYSEYFSFVTSNREILLILFHTETGYLLPTWVAISFSMRKVLHEILSLLTLYLCLLGRLVHIGTISLRENMNINLSSANKTGETEISPYSCCPQAEVLGIWKLLCLPCFPPFSLYISPTSFFSRAHFVVSNGPFLLLYTSPRSSFLIPHIFTLNSIASPFSFIYLRHHCSWR